MDEEKSVQIIAGKKKRILFVASHSSIEPLGLLHLGGLARDLGWERKYWLVKSQDYNRFREVVKDFKPDVVGASVYTGDHLSIFSEFSKLKRNYPEIQTILGGYHPSYFPIESSEFADYVVMSEGFNSLREILTGKAKPGIISLKKTEEFPHPDREIFYRDYSEYKESNIKSFITMTGCPYKCTYCYNSSTLEDLKNNLSPEIIKQFKECGFKGRLFPHNVRDINNVKKELEELIEDGYTKTGYCQDDVAGLNGVIPNILPFHAQMRFEMTVGDKGKKRLDKLRESGCTGLTLAIEAADYTIRKELLNRPMREEVIFEGMKNVVDRGYKVRTEQITGLIYGSTSVETPINLDADIDLIKLNIKLREETGGPFMSWASTFVPYPGSKLGNQAVEDGFYYIASGVGDKETLKMLSDNLSDSFFERSHLRFLREWVGPCLRNLRNNSHIWLSKEDNNLYTMQNRELRNHFNFLTEIPQGADLAEDYLKDNGVFSFEQLGKCAEKHLKKISLSNKKAEEILSRFGEIRCFAETLTENSEEQEKLKNLVPIFATIPEGISGMKRFYEYSKKRDGGFSDKNLSDAIRHNYYDLLYDVLED